MPGGDLIATPFAQGVKMDGRLLLGLQFLLGISSKQIKLGTGYGGWFEIIGV